MFGSPVLHSYLMTELDVVRTRYLVAQLIRSTGGGELEEVRLITALSEVCSNVVRYAQRGEVRVWLSDQGLSRTLQVEVIDEGPGISDLDWALQDSTSTSGTLGLGLSGARRLVDSFMISSPLVGQNYGTQVMLAVQWSLT